MAKDESAHLTFAERLNDLREMVKLNEMELADIERAQEAAHEAIADEQRAAEHELTQARAKRSSAASLVSRGLLSRYERIRSRDGSGALFPLRGSACGRCNTAVPLQRRNAIAAGRAIEVCEGCGALLYAPV